MQIKFVIFFAILALATLVSSQNIPRHRQQRKPRFSLKDTYFKRGQGPICARASLTDPWVTCQICRKTILWNDETMRFNGDCPHSVHSECGRTQMKDFYSVIHCKYCSLVKSELPPLPEPSPMRVMDIEYSDDEEEEVISCCSIILTGLSHLFAPPPQKQLE